MPFSLLFVLLFGPSVLNAPVGTPVLMAGDIEGLAGRLECGGTEPFWSLAIEGGNATFERPGSQGLPAVRLVIHDSFAASNRSGLWALRMQSSDGRESTALVRKAVCSDGMSELTNSYTVALLGADDTHPLLDGCCE